MIKSAKALTVAAGGAYAKSVANLRSGPGTTFTVAGNVAANQPLLIVGRNQAGDWLKLDSGLWIFAQLVSSVPVNLPVDKPIIQATPASTPVSAGAPTPQPVAQPTCNCSTDSYTCDSFGSHNEAQACFQYCIDQGSGDIHKLDRDGDMSVCENR